MQRVKSYGLWVGILSHFAYVCSASTQLAALTTLIYLKVTLWLISALLAAYHRQIKKGLPRH